MDLTADAEELLTRLGEVAPAEDVAEVRTAAEREAMRLRHRVVVPGHVLTVLVRQAADPQLLTELGVPASTTPAQLLDRTKAEVDAHATGAPAPATGAAEGRQPTPGITRPTRPAVEPCPACGDTEQRRYQSRRVPAPDGKGSATTRVPVCGVCGIDIASA
jgi:hypothetical protein